MTSDDLPRSHESSHVSHSMRFRVRVVAAAATLALLAVFVLQNSLTVRLHFLVFTVNTSVAWALIVAGAFGALFGLIFPRFRRLL